MPEAICCCLQTCIVVILMLVIEYKVLFVLPFASYTDTCDSIIMHCLGLFVVVYKQVSMTSLFGDGYVHSYKISLLYYYDDYYYYVTSFLS